LLILAAHFPLPILFESRRRHIQRFLKLSVQQSLLRPVLKLLKKYKLVVLGDRELQAYRTRKMADRKESVLSQSCLL
jgi:hypothetical protein